MLSDEERKAIENLKIEYEKLMKEDNILFPLYKSDAKRLIDIIEKQSKEIEELNYIKRCFDYCVEQKNKKWEDKIKAKIEEIDKEEKEQLKGTKGQDRYAIKQEYMHKRSVLQSLLEKE